MRFIEEAEAQARLEDVLDEAQRRPIIIQRQGTDTAGTLSIASYECLRDGAIQALLELRNEVAGQAAAARLMQKRLCRHTKQRMSLL